MTTTTAAEPDTRELATQARDLVNANPQADPTKTVEEFAKTLSKPCRCELGKPPLEKRVQGGPSKTLWVWLGAQEDHHFRLHFYERTDRWDWEIVT